MSRKKKHSYTETELRVAIQNARSIRQALKSLGLCGEGGNYRVIHRAIQEYQIDVSHFTQQGWAKNSKIGPKQPIENYLIKDSFSISSNSLKRRLISEEIFERICSKCHSDQWLGQPIPLELDHIDGEHYNNQLSNLRLLCPNCHAQTDTYRRRKKSVVHPSLSSGLSVKTSPNLTTST